MQYRCVEDLKGLQYVFLVSANVVNSAMLTAQRGTLIAFKKGARQSWEILDNKSFKGFNSAAYGKPMKINIDQATWDELMTNKLSAYKDMGFRNVPKLKIAKDPSLDLDLSKVRETPGGSLYMDKVIKCSNRACSKEIVGRQFYKFKRKNDGIVIISMGRFLPNDEEAQRVKPKSRLWFCADCGTKIHGGHRQQELPLIPTTAIEEIEALLDPKSTANAEFARGANWALRKLVASGKA